MAQHYFSRRPRRGGGRRLIGCFLRGVTVEFYVYPGVFSARGVDEGTRLLVESAVVPEEGVVLDMGCGYGVIGVTLAKRYPGLRVVMVDVNPAAVELSRMNARLNGVAGRVEVLQGSLYDPVEGRVFDAIISNPPMSAGMRVVEAIVRGAPRHLRRGGWLELVVRRGAQRVASLMEEVFGSVQVLARKHGYRVLAARLA